MDSRQILYFKAVCDEGGFARAAAKLYITPQGISKAIHKLEEELGVRLFETTTLGVRLTDYGVALRNQAADYINQHSQIVDRIEAMKKNMSRSLVIGLQSGSASVLPKGFIPDFIEGNPDIKVGIRSYNRESMAEAMEEGEIKLWICSGPFDTELYDVLYSKVHRLFLILSEKHPLAAREKLRMSDLQGVPIINIAYDMGQQKSLSKNMAEIGVAPRYIMNNSDRALTMDLIQRGLAVSFHGGGFYKFFPGIVRREIEDVDIRFSSGIILKKSAYRTEAILRFVDYVSAMVDAGAMEEGVWK